jgi:hypothetical protein
VRIGDAQPVEQAKQAREDLFEKYRALLTAILSPEQRDALPGARKEMPEAANPAMLKQGVAQPTDGADQIEQGSPGNNDTNPRNVPEGEKPSTTKPANAADSAAGNGFGVNNNPVVKQRPRG